MITLERTLIPGITLELPDELIWEDEFSWGGIEASMLKTIQGKVIILQQAVLSQEGRPITLTSDNAWITREVLDNLFEWSCALEQPLILTMHDTSTIPCRFRHWEKPVIVAAPVVPTAFHDASTYYNLTLRLSIL